MIAAWLRWAILILILPETLAAALAPAPLAWRVALSLPAVALPSLLAFEQLRAGEKRAAIGLGATRLDRLRRLWLPQIGPGILASLVLAAIYGAILRALP